MEGTRCFPELPTDVFAQILLRVPAESLMEAKVVCKRWHGPIHELINSEQFVNSHLEHWKSGPMMFPRSAALISCQRRHPRTKFVLFNFENLEVKAHSRDLRLEDCLRHALPELRSRKKHAHFWGDHSVFHSCNGLLLLGVKNRCSNDTALLLVCNLITKSYRLLPRYSFKADIWGFHWEIVYDASVGLYKIIGLDMRAYIHKIRVMRCFIFKLHRGKAGKSASWKELHIESPCNYVSYKAQPVAFVGGKVHWTLRPNDYYIDDGDDDHDKFEAALLSLDLSTEKLRVAKILPEFLSSRWKTLHCISSDNMPCIGYENPLYPEDLELWKIDNFDHPVWRKLHVIRRPPSTLFYQKILPGIFMPDEGKLIIMKHWLYKENDAKLVESLLFVIPLLSQEKCFLAAFEASSMPVGKEK